MKEIRFEDTTTCQLYESTFVDSKDAYDAIEELIYITQELTPTHRDWKHELHRTGSCAVDYHCVEFFNLVKCSDNYFELREM